MLRTMENDYLCGDKLSYPTTLNKGYELAINWRGPGLKKTRGPHRQLELGNTLVQSGGLRGATNNNNNNNNNAHTRYNNDGNTYGVSNIGRPNNNRKPPARSTNTTRTVAAFRRRSSASAVVGQAKKQRTALPLHIHTTATNSPPQGQL